MRGKLAKRLRKFAVHDTPDLPVVGYTTKITGQDYKKAAGLSLNETVVLDECRKQYYKVLKKIWKKYNV